LLERRRSLLERRRALLERRRALLERRRALLERRLVHALLRNGDISLSSEDNSTVYFQPVDFWSIARSVCNYIVFRRSP
jgi:hypothetical protein